MHGICLFAYLFVSELIFLCYAWRLFVCLFDRFFVRERGSMFLASDPLTCSLHMAGCKKRVHSYTSQREKKRQAFSKSWGGLRGVCTRGCYLPLCVGVSVCVCVCFLMRGARNERWRCFCACPLDRHFTGPALQRSDKRTRSLCRGKVLLRVVDGSA